MTRWTHCTPIVAVTDAIVVGHRCRDIHLGAGNMFNCAAISPFHPLVHLWYISLSKEQIIIGRYANLRQFSAPPWAPEELAETEVPLALRYCRDLFWSGGSIWFEISNKYCIKELYYALNHSRGVQISKLDYTRSKETRETEPFWRDTLATVFEPCTIRYFL